MRLTGAILAMCALVAGASLNGCAGTRIATPKIAPSIRDASADRMRKPIPRSRLTATSDQIPVVNRIDARINPAAIRVCQRTFTNADQCVGLLRSRTLTVYEGDARINAFVGDRYDISMLGGLISHAGSDGEIAYALAHEYSHAVTVRASC